jgi:hypothetical protein
MPMRVGGPLVNDTLSEPNERRISRQRGDVKPGVATVTQGIGHVALLATDVRTWLSACAAEAAVVCYSSIRGDYENISDFFGKDSLSFVRRWNAS